MNFYLNPTKILLGLLLNQIKESILEFAQLSKIHFRCFITFLISFHLRADFLFCFLIARQFSFLLKSLGIHWNVRKAFSLKVFDLLESR